MPARSPLEEGIALFNGGRFAQAAARFGAALRRGAGDDALYLRATALSAAGRKSPALADAEAFLRRRPAHVEAWKLKAELERGLGRLEKALASLERVLALEPKAVPELIKTAVLLRELGRPREALKRCRIVLRLEPASIEAQELRSALEGALAEDGTPSVEPRHQLYRRLVSARRYRQAFVVGEALLDAGPSVSSVRMLIYPWDPRRYSVLAKAHLRALKPLLKDRAAAPWAAHYAAILGANANAMRLVDRYPPSRYGWMYQSEGRLWLSRRELARAAACFRLSLAQPPHDRLNSGFLAETYACMGKPERALGALRSALRGAPASGRGELLAWQGALELWLGRYAAAERSLARARRLEALWSFCWSGGAKVMLGRPREALDDLDRALSLYPNDQEARVWRGEALRLLGRPREALAALSGVGADNPWAAVNRELCRAVDGPRKRRLLNELKRARGNRRAPSHLDLIWLGETPKKR